ncbi:hypothetical protein P170DRAFT_171292 [Aspergillus steynii IBT 23096]|uniref:Uncharacterized protein n=1 Tax=Aspergillus steynii IBT 23096 TaxID=1392250 RepID=A0A2I2G7U5_9EURO|nr:uncharacterized protein P170DRAFT_171292 [Aspergillus steynii IBT 23096]PLB48952.1 hypothetical protein P170DRAFT_171292 [Aspergillus steynii IBT 23096]
MSLYPFLSSLFALSFILSCLFILYSGLLGHIHTYTGITYIRLYVRFFLVRFEYFFLHSFMVSGV